jgi:TonB family protein
MVAVAPAPSRAQDLRVAAVWGTTVVALRALGRGESFVLGDGEAAVLPVPDGLDMSPVPVRAAGGGWELDARGTISGTLSLRGRTEDPASIARAGAPIPVMPGDYGLLQYGQFSIFFQYSPKPDTLKTGYFGPELLAVLAIFSSTVLHVGVLGMLRVLMTPPPLGKPLELTNPDEFAARFGLKRARIEEPPPPTAGDDKGAGVKDPGAQDKKQQGGGEKMKGAEGKLGLKAKGERAELPGDVKRAENLGGISDVLNSETGEEMKRTLNTINTVANALSGLNSKDIVYGGGPGTGVKGSGAGGGGTNMGVPYGAGNMNTGWGPGAGGGMGGGSGGPGRAGAGGPGAGGKGGAGGPAEQKVAAGGAAAAKGGLSPEQIRRVVEAHRGALKMCYEIEAQRNPDLKGGVTVSFAIDPGGSVTGASIASSTLGSQRVEGCILRQIRSWKFPSAETPSTVAAYPFKFGIGG